MEMIFNELSAAIFVSAIVFTAFGWYLGVRNKMETVVAATIDNLIEDGYLKTRGTGKDMEILKWREWKG